MRARALITITAALALVACAEEPASDEVQTVDLEGKPGDPLPSPPPPLETTAAFGIDRRPVRVGFDGPDFDACGSYGEVTGFDPEGDNYLSVRAAPDTSAEELDRITSGTGVSLCESENGWHGIVYEGSGAQGTACETGSPVADVQNYSGPCRQGWVSSRFVEVIAG